MAIGKAELGYVARLEEWDGGRSIHISTMSVSSPAAHESPPPVLQPWGAHIGHRFVSLC